ncbi:MAG: ABC transporter substrate-binding protein [Solirubrobacteraceae bacterium MAG38_C4-C5]|nr:ABC transporter substrate-binding protein [Candidatus Siliceabacter maunaloa]
MTERMILAHGCSLSNLPLLVAADRGFLAEEGIEAQAPELEELSGTADLLSSGRSLLGTAAFTLALGMPTAPPSTPTPAIDVVAVAGSGLRGVSIVAHPDVGAVAALESSVVGTFAEDPLELLLREELHHAGVAPDGVELRYLSSMQEAVEALRGREVAAVTVAEPFGVRLRREGFVTLSDGTDLWGPSYPDTILVAARGLVEDEPATVAGAIRAMRRAERLIVTAPDEALQVSSRHFPGFTLDELGAGLAAQPSQVALRPSVPFLRERWAAARTLALVTEAAFPAHRIDLRLLEAELDAQSTGQKTTSLTPPVQTIGANPTRGVA